MQDVQLDAVDVIRVACEKEGIPLAEAALRWMMHHSHLGESPPAILTSDSCAGLQGVSCAALGRCSASSRMVPCVNLARR